MFIGIVSQLPFTFDFPSSFNSTPVQKYDHIYISTATAALAPVKRLNPQIYRKCMEKCLQRLRPKDGIRTITELDKKLNMCRPSCKRQAG